MLVKKLSKLIVLLLVLFLLVGCAGGIVITDPDEIKIHAIADSIKTAIEDKDVDMFMTSVSLDYSDSAGGTYDSIYVMAQNIVSEIEAAEEMAGSSVVNLVISSSISNLTVLGSTANSDLEITISAKVIFFTVYSEDRTFETIFQKEVDDWKIISMMEI